MGTNSQRKDWTTWRSTLHFSICIWKVYGDEMKEWKPFQYSFRAFYNITSVTSSLRPAWLRQNASPLSNALTSNLYNLYNVIIGSLQRASIKLQYRRNLGFLVLSALPLDPTETFLFCFLRAKKMNKERRTLSCTASLKISIRVTTKKRNSATKFEKFCKLYEIFHHMIWTFYTLKTV